eukprot:5204120-Amphidinium_carterae.1
MALWQPTRGLLLRTPCPVNTPKPPKNIRGLRGVQTEHVPGRGCWDACNASACHSAERAP